ncbi:uncharacterized protein LOC144159784 [Haemaphysalis longicornis]
MLDRKMVALLERRRIVRQLIASFLGKIEDLLPVKRPRITIDYTTEHKCTKALSRDEPHRQLLAVQRASGGRRGPIHGAGNPGSRDKAYLIDARSRASPLNRRGAGDLGPRIPGRQLTAMERLFRRRQSLRSQLDGVIAEAEAALRGQPGLSASENALASRLPTRPMSCPTPATSQSKLPQLDLIKFDGNRKNWQRFWMQFSSAVHNNSELSTADKFNYLNTLVTGAAASAISGLQASEECYKDAVDILKKRFGDERIIVQDHLRSLLDLKPVSSSNNTQQLRRLYDQIQVHVRSLKALGTSPANYCLMLREVLFRTLPPGMVLKYHELFKSPTCTSTTSSSTQAVVDQQNETAQPEQELQQLLDFFDHQVRCREAVERQTAVTTPDVAVTTQEPPRQQRFRNLHTVSALQNSANNPQRCLFCLSVKHRSEVCDSDEWSLKRKKQLLFKEGRCFRCLKKWHMAKDCRGRLRCDKCPRRHATTMCAPDASSRNEVTSTPVSLVSRQTGPMVLLQTLTATVKGSASSGRYRILFEGGSQRSFMTADASQKLGCEFLEEETLTVGVFGGQKTTKTMRKVRLLIVCENTERPVHIEALEVDAICNEHIPVPDDQVIKTREAMRLDTRALCARGFEETKITILIGSDHYWDLVTGNVKPVTTKLKAVETLLGWTVQGPLPLGANVTHCANVVVLRASVEANEVSEVLNRFWDFESIGVKCEDERSSENDLVITKFEETIKKTNERYEVALPWKPRVDLADNLAVAAKRLHILMKKLGKDANLMERYDATIRTYLEEGSAERVPPTDNVPRGRLYYMPHRAVIREDRSTTKVRIVFDASSHENGAKSLNENLEAGPNLNPDVVTLLLRFRRYKVAKTADVE